MAHPTLGEVAETWLTHTEPNVAATTIRECRNALNRYWLPLFRDRPIASIGYEELAVYVASLPLQAAKTFNNVMTPLRGLFAYALEAKKVSHDITQDIDSRKAQKANPDPLYLEEVQIVLSHMLSK